MNIGSSGVNIANIESYRTALKGLTTEQSVFALASKGATDEQIRQILATNQATASEVEAALAKAGLTTATKALTQAEMVEIATKNGVAKSEAEALLSKIGITATEKSQVVVKKQVTYAMLEQAVANGTLTKAEASQIATMLGLNAAETTNIGITNILTASFTKLWAVITAHPIGAILTAIGAVAVGTIAYINKVDKDAEKALEKAHGDAENALEESKSSLSDNKSELQSINSELDQVKNRIKEISSIGSPTLTEQNELDKLSMTNNQLEIQKNLLENNIKLKQKSAALDAKELLDTQTELKDFTLSSDGTISENTEKYDYKKAAELNAYNLKEAYNIYLKAIREGNISAQEEAQSLIDSVAGESSSFTSELLNIIESFKYDDGTIIDGYEDIYNEYMGMIYNIQSLTNPDTFLDIAKSITIGTGIDYEKAISEAYALAYEGNFDVDNLNQDFVKALADAGIDESTINYIFSLKQKEYQTLVDKINSKYDSSKVQFTYWDGKGDIYHDYDKEESTKKDLEKINRELNDYAKNNPIEFQLISSFDGNFDLLDTYIEEEKEKARSSTDYVGDYVINAINRIYNEAKSKDLVTEVIGNETDISWALSEENSKAIDDFQGKIKDLKGALELLKTGDLGNNDLVDIMQTFPELQNASGDLETAIKSLIDTLLNKLLSLLGSDAPTQLIESIREIANVVDEVDISPIEKSIAEMSKVSETLKPLNSVFEDFKENAYLSQESIESLQKSFGKLDSFDSFISTVTKAGLTEQELDSALDKIITDYLDQTDALDSLNVGTAEYVANVLSEVGVSNSLEVVLSRLGLTLDEYARLKEYANEKGIDLCNITSSEIASILSEIGVTEDAITSFANLALAKENTNIATIDTSGDIKNLSALVEACGAATSALSALADAKMLMERANKGDSGAISQLESLANLSGASSVDAWYQSLVNKSQNEVDAALKNAGNRNATANFTAPDYKYTPKKEKKAKEKKEKQVKETEIDYAKNTIEDLKDSYEDLTRVTSNLEKNGDLTDYYKKHTKAIQDENDALTALIGTESKVGKNGKIIKATGLTGAKESYEKEYEKALKATGNADKYRKLIENGSLDVITYKGELGENLKTALDAYGNIRDTENEIADYEDKIAENNRKIKEDSKEQAEYKLKEKEYEEEIATSNKEKNNAIDGQIKQLKVLRDLELADAKSPEEVSQINNEYDNKINSLKDKKASNSEDTYKLKQEGLEIDKEEAKSLEERNKIIEKEKKNRKKIYEQALKQADTEEEKTQLTREYNNDMLSYDNEQKKNIQDKLQMQYDSLEAQKDETATVAEKNKIIEQEKFLRERIYLQEIAQVKTEEERNKLQKEYLADIKTLDKEAADNTTNAKNSYIDLQETIADLLDNDVELRKAMGENITEADYGNLINQQLHIKQLYQQQYDEQLKILDTLEPTSEEWDKTVDIMSNALAKINACDTAILKYNKAMKETPVENIKKGVDALTRLKDEVSDMIGLLDDNSKSGITAMTLYQKKLSIIETQIQQNNQAMALLNKNTEEFQELQAENRNLANEQLSIYEELSRIRIDSINEETERMKELVDLKKKENEEEYNKQKLTKQITKDNESLAKMEAKLQQLKANNSDGANNKLILELESRIAKKKEELSEEQLEREYEAKQDALDKEYELKEKANQEEIESIEKSNSKKEQIAKDMLAGVAYTYEGYFQEVNSMADNYGIKLTDSIKSQWKDRQSAVEEYISIAKQAVSISSLTPNDYNVGNNGQQDKNIDSFTIGTADANDIKINPPKKAESVVSQVMNILKHGEGATAKSDLNKYIVSKYGKPISYKQMSTAYNLLTGDNTTSKDFKGNTTLINDLLSQLKNAGFSNGGIIEKASKIIKGNGDNVLMTGRTGEAVLTKEQTKAFMSLRNYIPAFATVAKNLPLNNVQRKSDINVTIPMQFHDCVTNDEMLKQMKGIVYQEANGAINEVLRKM